MIPCAVDLERFSRQGEARRRVRAELGLVDSTVMVYSGSLGSWYLPDAMLDFYEVARSMIPGLAFLVLTPHPAVMKGLVSRRGVADVIVRAVSPALVPEYLSGADFGISFIDPAPSKAASSPTKLAEYLACGLPVVLNAGVGDVDELSHEPEWVVLPSLGEASHAEAARRIAVQLKRPGVRDRARAIAARRFALEEAVRRYSGLYARVVGSGAAC